MKWCSIRIEKEGDSCLIQMRVALDPVEASSSTYRVSNDIPYPNQACYWFVREIHLSRKARRTLNALTIWSLLSLSAYILVRMGISSCTSSLRMASNTLSCTGPGTYPRHNPPKFNQKQNNENQSISFHSNPTYQYKRYAHQRNTQDPYQHIR